TFIIDRLVRGVLVGEARWGMARILTGCARPVDLHFKTVCSLVDRWVPSDPPPSGVAGATWMKAPQLLLVCAHVIGVTWTATTRGSTAARRGGLRSRYQGKVERWPAHWRFVR